MPYLLCVRTQPKHTASSPGGGGGGTGVELGSVWWLYTNWMYDCQLIMMLIIIIIICVFLKGHKNIISHIPVQLCLGIVLL